MIGLLTTTLIAFGIAVGAVMAAVRLTRAMNRDGVTWQMRLLMSIGMALLVGVLALAALVAFVGGSCLAIGWSNGGHYGFET